MSKYIGDVSAYAYAVSKGYTGTEEEFAELMADYADVGQRAEDAAESALNSKTAAQTAAQTATTKAGEASTSATSASGAASAASASASAASGSATSAANSATAASGSATAAAGSATTATTKASEASASATAAQTAQTAAEAAQSAAETAQGKAEDAQAAAETTAQSISASAAQIATNTANITQLQSEVSQKANIDGAYSDLTAGNAEQLVSTVYEEDSVPYIFRTAGGSMDIGDREEDMLVGGTVAWNQLIKEINSQNWSAESGVTATFNDNKIVFTSPSSNFGVKTSAGEAFSPSHVYLATALAKAASAGSISFLFGSSAGVNSVVSVDATEKQIGGIAKTSSNTSGRGFYITALSTSANVEITVKNIVVFDLTQMFGSTIADYIYNLEQSTAGAGVAFFRKLFPKDYYPYDAGTLKSVEGVSSHDMVGFNQWDEEWEVGAYNNIDGTKAVDYNRIRCKDKIQCVPNTAYFYSCNTGAYTGNLTILFYDADENFISYYDFNPDHLFTTPDNCHYMTFYTGQAYGTTYNHDICINLHWDGERDGEYEPYVKHSYPLDSSLTLRGIPKLDSANNLYYDGDTYESDGTVTRKYGIVDLGTLYWQYDTIFYASMQNYTPLPKWQGLLVCSPYVNRMVSLTNPTDMSIFVSNSQAVPILRIADSRYTDAATFKTALSGVYMVYELATPTTESADPYQNPQIVDDFGTEEYVTTSIVPVGHVTNYQPNLRAKLEMSPDSPDGDGDYIVRQSNGENSYVSLASTVTIQDILARLTALEGNTNEG